MANTASLEVAKHQPALLLPQLIQLCILHIAAIPFTVIATIKHSPQFTHPLPPWTPSYRVRHLRFVNVRYKLFHRVHWNDNFLICILVTMALCCITQISMTLAEGFDLSLSHPLTVVALNIDMHNIYAIVIIFGVLHYNLSEFVFVKTKRRKIVYFSFKMSSNRASL